MQTLGTMSMNTVLSAGLRCAALSACLLVLGGCHKITGAANAPAPGASVTEPQAAANKESAEEGVTLSAEQVQKMGIAVSPALAASYTPQAAGYAVVVAHETLAQGVAELSTAEATQRQSR